MDDAGKLEKVDCGAAGGGRNYCLHKARLDTDGILFRSVTSYV